MRWALESSTDMSGVTDQELSFAAAHRILRSVAHRAWTEVDYTAGERQTVPLSPVDDLAHEDVAEEERDESSPSVPFPWWQNARVWYRNEVPEEFIQDCENEIWRPAPCLDLTEASQSMPAGSATSG
jgi:hypothetical protein